MCLIFVAWRAHPCYRLVVAANRDEFHARPTAPAAPWPGAEGEPQPAAGTTAAVLRDREGDGTKRLAGKGSPGERPGILAGRDLEAGGTWLGVTADGRFAALTNFRAAALPRPDAPSRGGLVVDYLRGGLGAREHARRVAREAGRYRGFNLLLADGHELLCVTNRGEEEIAAVPPGCHGLSNDRLNAPWPKVKGGLAEFRRWMHDGFERDDLFALLADDEPAAEADLRGMGLERTHSGRFVRDEVYGTRSSTVACIDPAGAIVFEERSFDSFAVETGRAVFVGVAGQDTDFEPVTAVAGSGRAAAATLPLRAEAAG